MKLQNSFANNILRIIIVLAAIFSLNSCKKANPTKSVDTYFATTLPKYATEAKKYVNEYNLNQDYCILVDYGLDSGKCRVFLWSFKENKVIYKAHTMHGSGGGSTVDNAVLSNVSGSNCSSPGHFMITRHEGANIRPSLRLQGLDGTNANAYDRGIMLHGAWLVDYALERKVKYLPIDPIWCAGCVTVSTEEMSYLYQFIRNQYKPMMLWTFKTPNRVNNI